MRHSTAAYLLFSTVIAAGTLLLTRPSVAQYCGDVNRSGTTTASDALLVLRRAVGDEVELVCATLPATGQTTSYGPGTDGDEQRGAPRAFVDNGDGTITDLNTGLMWEKKGLSSDIHNVGNTYTWCVDADGPTHPASDGKCDNGTNEMDGTIKTVFLDTLNDVAGGGANCFAGYCDWRIPNIKELQSITNYACSVRRPM